MANSELDGSRRSTPFLFGLLTQKSRKAFFIPFVWRGGVAHAKHVSLIGIFSR